MASLVDQNAAAEMLRISPRTLEKWRSTGGGPPFVKIGSAVRYDLADLERWAATRKFTNTAEYKEVGHACR